MHIPRTANSQHNTQQALINTGQGFSFSLHHVNSIDQ